ncbi:MAG: ABC transporter ATP-binding protein [Flavobacteriales bacterium]|nr:ABC transporter ATP-binding protein [Flavobacteriales bacterium]MBT6014123.1 ABC transporter ATP-binding protein [Flavobacteriales bacterium]MBT7481071.1 ABC transporter ATP-binding protein [Flavobacteriales bacterium]
MKNLFYLNKYFAKYRKLLVIGTFFILISNVFALYPAEFVRHAFDYIQNVLENPTSDKKIHFYLLKFGGLIVLFAILKGIFMYFMRQTVIVMSRKIEFDLKNEIYKQYQNLSLSFYKKNNTGDLMNRITEDVNRVRMYLGPALMYAINMAFLFILVIGKMLSINTTLTLYVLIPLPILAIAVYHVSNKINKNSERVQNQLSVLTSISQETFSAINIVKIFRNEENSFKLFFDSCKKYTNRQLKLVSVEAWFFPLIILLIGTSTITTIYIGGLENFKGKITTGNIAEFIIYVNMLTWPVASVGWVTSLVQRAEASMERINEFLKIETEIKNTNPNNTLIKGNITFENVSFIYPDTGIKALKNISFSLKENETLGIFGKTGSGKSTIANLLCRMYDIDNGEIFYDNTKIGDLNLFDLRKNIGYVPQDGFLFSGTVNENISFGIDSKEEEEEEIKEAAKTAEITEEIESFPDKYNTIIGERGVQLSGGQRQRLSIARAIYINPPIYIFDDCLSAIDANKEKLILKNLSGKTKENTNIIISHRTSSLQNANQIIVLDEGEIIEKGTHNELINNNGFYAEMHKKQTTENL